MDNADGVLQAQVVGLVDTVTVGSYALTYTAKDSSGNQSSALVRNVIVRDTQAPVVALRGLSEIRMTVGTVFEEPGGLAVDEVDGTLPIQVEGVVDSATPGNYILTYTARDFSGNVSLPVVRLVVIEAPRDTQPPVIELLGEASLLIAVGENFEEPGALVTDNVDGNLGATVRGLVNPSIPGFYTLTYTARDEAGNAAKPVIRLVQVVDQTAPILSLVGEALLVLEVGATFEDPGFLVEDNVDPDPQVRVTGEVDTMSPGAYAFTYAAVDASGNQSPALVRTLLIKDTQPPVIQLNGLSPVDVLQDRTYVDAGATAVDAVDGQVEVESRGTIDTSVVGIQVLTFTARDASGNRAKPVTRVVRVVSDTPPVITLNGSPEVYLEVGDPFVDPGASVVDDRDDLVEVVVLGEVDVNQSGNYVLTYTAVDNGGKRAQPVTRLIFVEDMTPPIITLLGESYLALTVGDDFEDPGALVSDNIDDAVELKRLGQVDTQVPGIYSLTYTATDAAGNRARKVVRIIRVEAPKDTTPPVVFLSGDAFIKWEYGQTFIDPGAVAVDDVDDVLEVEVNGSVDAEVEGLYVITYSATDAAGNVSEPRHRIVVVEAPKDTTPPTLLMLGNANIELEIGGVFDDPGVSARDDFDEVVEVSTSGGVDMSQEGVYVLTYTASDAAGNQAAPLTRVVVVTGIRDLEPPTIYLQGESFLSITQGSTFEDPGAEVEDNIDSPQAAEVFGTVNTQEIGTYTLTYTAMDEAGNKATPVTRIVEVIAPIDTTPPVLTLLGEAFIIMLPGPNAFEDPGATALDDVDGELVVEVLGEVQWDLEGFYALTYTAQDSAGNQATPVVRVIMIASSAIEEIPNQTLSARQARSEEPGGRPHRG